MKTDKHKFKKPISLLLPFVFLLFTCVSIAQNGKDAQWATAGKQGVGTSVSLNSKVWFTLAQGVMTEVYYPDVTVANVHLLQFVVVNPKTKKVETEQDDATHEIIVNPTGLSGKGFSINSIDTGKSFSSSSSLAFTQISRSKEKSKSNAGTNGVIIGGSDEAWKIEKTYVTNPANNSIVFSVEFKTDDPNNELYVYYDPSLANSGMHDTGWSEGNYLLSSDGKISSALTCGRCKFTNQTNGLLGVNDGLTQLKQSGKIGEQVSRVENGNLVQVAKVTPVSIGSRPAKMIFVLSFGNSPKDAMTTAYNSLQKGFDSIYREYQEDWANYLKTLRKVDPKYQAQFNMAAMILKAHEDKTIRGANIASLTVPWGGGANANENNIGGYHLIWSRDLYQVATAFMALGDKESAIRALDFLFKVQQKPDGSFPQNSFLDGKPFWGSLQLDEVAFPLILAHELGKTDKETYENHVKKSADFIVKNGPITPQERWEEEGGYSPSTIAAEIAGLVCAAEIANKNGDTESARRWLKTADDWQANIEKWTVTKTGKYSKEPYYLRITQGKPDSGEKLELNNGAGFFDERDIVDAGFLELVRLGIKSPDDPIIQNSLKVIDQVIRVKTPNGDGFYRYNHDGYGEMDDGRRWNWNGKYTGKGRLWALLSGERGQYELAKCYEFLESDHKRNDAVCGNDGRGRLETMANFANEGLMIPEQIWDKAETPKTVDKQFVPELKFGEGTGSATPLAWSMAQFIRLAVNLKEGRNLDTPKVVYDRYVLGKVVDNYANNMEPIVNIWSCGSGSFSNEKIIDLPIKKRNIADLLSLQPSVTRDGNVRTDQANVTLDGIDVNEKGEMNQTVFACPKTDSKELPEFRVYSNPQNPRINKNEATIVYLESAEKVEIAGDFTGWQPRELKFNLSQGEDNKNTRGFEITLQFAPTARVEYKLIVDGKWITDPLNPNKVDNGVGGENSFFTMPDYKPTIWDKNKYADYVEKYFRSRVEIMDSKIYGERELTVYVPKGFETQRLPVLYLLDGREYRERTSALIIQENLMNANKVKPFIMVFLDPKDRMKEYWANDDYAKFLAEEVVPAIDAKYSTIKSREGRAVLGASLGGITSVNVGLKYPQVFSRIGGQSVSWWVDDERIVKNLDKFDDKFTFYFDDGTIEGVEDSNEAVSILRKKGFDVVYKESEDGHNWTAWRNRLADAFIALMN